MNESQSDRAMIHRIAASLDAGCTRLDEGTRRRLDRARRAAVADGERRPRAWSVFWIAPAAATAAALVLALIVAIGMNDPGLEPPPRTADLDLLTREEFELFTEDPEFYAWVARLPRPPEHSEQSG